VVSNHIVRISTILPRATAYWIACVLTVLATVAVVVAAEEYLGSVGGTVVNEEGKPVEGAIIKAYPTDRGLSYVLPSDVSDRTGHFLVRHLWWGKFAVCGKKEDEGYRDPCGGLTDGFPFPRITLKPRHPKAVVTLRLGPKAGVLVGTVSDANTGALVSPCIEFRKPPDAANYLLTGSVPFGGAQFRFLLPSNTDVTMEVRELNHKRWFYPGTLKKSESTSFRLTPGQELKLDIRMQPEPSADRDACEP
jgi:hypothetical protein